MRTSTSNSWRNVRQVLTLGALAVCSAASRQAPATDRLAERGRRQAVARYQSDAHVFAFETVEAKRICHVQRRRLGEYARDAAASDRGRDDAAAMGDRVGVVVVVAAGLAGVTGLWFAGLLLATKLLLVLKNWF